jgi:hypothetical protein
MELPLGLRFTWRDARVEPHIFADRAGLGEGVPDGRRRFPLPDGPEPDRI